MLILFRKKKRNCPKCDYKLTIKTSRGFIVLVVVEEALFWLGWAMAAFADTWVETLGATMFISSFFLAAWIGFGLKETWFCKECGHVLNGSNEIKA